MFDEKLIIIGGQRNTGLKVDLFLVSISGEINLAAQFAGFGDEPYFPALGGPEVPPAVSMYVAYRGKARLNATGELKYDGRQVSGRVSIEGQSSTIQFNLEECEVHDCSDNSFQAAWISEIDRIFSETPFRMMTGAMAFEENVQAEQARLVVELPIEFQTRERLDHWPFAVIMMIFWGAVFVNWTWGPPQADARQDSFFPIFFFVLSALYLHWSLHLGRELKLGRDEIRLRTGWLVKSTRTFQPKEFRAVELVEQTRTGPLHWWQDRGHRNLREYHYSQVRLLNRETRGPQLLVRRDLSNHQASDLAKKLKKAYSLEYSDD